jgi:type IV pilus assembly protein PilN
MTNINLLPWREYKRNEHIDRDLLMFILVFLGVIVAILIGHIYIKNQTRIYQRGNSLLEAEIKKVNVVNKKIEQIKIDRDYYIKIIKIIEGFQKIRYMPTRMFDEIARAVPRDIYLTKIALVDNKIYIEGVADSNNAVSQLIKNLEFSSIFIKSELVEIKAISNKEEQQKSMFKIKLEQFIS